MKKNREDAKDLLAEYEALPESGNLTQLVHWLLKAVLMLLVAYINEE